MGHKKLYKPLSFLGGVVQSMEVGVKHIHHHENLERKAIQYAAQRSQFTHHHTRQSELVLSLRAN